MSIKIDLHTHSILSPDGGITAAQYHQVLEKNQLDCIAITDHNEISFAEKMQSELGKEKIIIGEEITTKQGDIIGLFLDKKIEPYLELAEAVKKIKSQGGLVYIPHPFETVRSGIAENALDNIKDKVDIVEIKNGRAFFQNFGFKATAWAVGTSSPQASSSDAHRRGGLGRTYSIIDAYPSVKSLPDLLSAAEHVYARPTFFDIIAPKMNRLKKFFRIKQNG